MSKSAVKDWEDCLSPQQAVLRLWRQILLPDFCDGVFEFIVSFLFQNSRPKQSCYPPAIAIQVHLDPRTVDENRHTVS